MLLLALLFRRRKRRMKRKRQFWIHDTIRRRKELGEFHRLVQELRLDSTRFQQYFRMSPSTFDDLVNMVGPYIQKQTTRAAHLSLSVKLDQVSFLLFYALCHD